MNAVLPPLLVVLLLFGACSGAPEAPPPDCIAVPPDLVALIEEGLTAAGDASMDGAMAVPADAEGFWIMAADIDAPGMEDEDDVGVWAIGGDALDTAHAGSVVAIDSTAREFSDWGTAGTAYERFTGDRLDDARACLQ